MINEQNYFRAMDRAVVSLGFDPYDMDANDFTSFYWGLMTSAYMELVQPVVSHLPRRAAVCVGEALELWADGEIEREEDISSHAQKHYAKWFDPDFLSLWRKASMTSRAMLSRALEDYVNKFLASEGLPGVSLDVFSMREFVKSMEEKLREKALPFMLHEIFSYEFVEMDDAAADRAGLLRENREALKSERDFRIGLERAAISETLVTEELIFAFARDVIAELCSQLNSLKRRSISGGN